MQTLDGTVKMLDILLREHHPNITEDELWDVARTLGQDKVQEAIDRSAGIPPENVRQKKVASV